jgi:hypothetical protein
MERQRRGINLKPGASPQEFKSPRNQALKGAFQSGSSIAPVDRIKPALELNRAFSAKGFDCLMNSGAMPQANMRQRLWRSMN